MKKAAGKRLTIGFMTPQIDATYNTLLWHGVSDAAKEKDINVVIFEGKMFNSSRFHEYGGNCIYELINPLQLDGLILATGTLINHIGISCFENYVKRFSSIPRVSVSVPLKGIPSVVIDNKTGMKSVISHLIEVHKKKRIAFICGPQTNVEAVIRYDAYREALAEHGLPFDENLIFSGDFITESGVQAARELIDVRKVDFDAVVGANDPMAFGAFQFFQQRGIRVPHDVAVAGFDNDEDVQFAEPPFTTVNQPIYKLGWTSVEILKGMIDGKKVPEQTALVAQVVIRQSCGCIPIPERRLEAPQLSTDNNECCSRIDENRSKLKKVLLHSLDIPRVQENDYSRKSDLLINALIDDLKDSETGKEHLISTFNEILTSTFYLDSRFPDWQNALVQLRTVLFPLITSQKEGMYVLRCIDKALLLFYEYKVRKENFKEHNIEKLQMGVRELLNNINSIVDIEELLNEIRSRLPVLKINSCYLMIYQKGQVRKINETDWEIPQTAKVGLAHSSTESEVLINQGIEFNCKDLIPDQFIPADRQYTWIIRELFAWDEHYGYAMYEVFSRDAFVYVTTHDIISAGLQTVNLWNKRKLAEEQLKKRTVELEESNKKLAKLDDLKNEFIANVTHDFRSPLTVILNTADLGLKSPDKSEDGYKRKLSVIYDASLKFKDTIDRLLDVARMDACGVKLKVQKVNIREFLENLVDYYRSASLNSNIQILFTYPPHEICNLYTDPEKLEEIVNNVVSNAFKYVDQNTGKINIELKATREKVIITITDNGIGIPAGKLESVFERFEQVDSGKTSIYKGSGIGLAFSRQLMDYLKGRIWAESEGPGKGASFIIELKRGKHIFSDQEIGDESQDSATNKLQMSKVKRIISSNLEQRFDSNKIETLITEPASEDEFDQHKCTILIIDDSKLIRNIVKDYLINSGYKNFIFAKDGKQGIDAAYNYRPDCIICDLNMPIMRGDEFHNELAKNPDFKYIPFIFLSAVTDKSIISERKKRGAVAYLAKPFDEGDLIATVDVHLKKYLDFKETLIQASIDELTRVNNRRTILKLLKSRVSERKLSHLSLLLLDIDHFKEFNDTYGHQVGDRVLANVGTAIRNTIRTYDQAGRYGGEEFLILLPDTNLSQALVVAERLRNEIASTGIVHNNIRLSPTASIGVVSLIDHAPFLKKMLGFKNLEKMYNVRDSRNADWKYIEEMKNKIAPLLINMADTAMYQGKHTKCLMCGFQDSKEEKFTNGKCPECGCEALDKGRNRVVSYKDTFIQ
jgi:diguanylate cyclase (GGDEF)-like protein